RKLDLQSGESQDAAGDVGGWLGIFQHCRGKPAQLLTGRDKERLYGPGAFRWQFHAGKSREKSLNRAQGRIVRLIERVRDRGHAVRERLTDALERRQRWRRQVRLDLVLRTCQEGEEA